MIKYDEMTYGKPDAPEAEQPAVARLRGDYEAMCAKDYDNATLIHNLRADLEKAKEALHRVLNCVGSVEVDRFQMDQIRVARAILSELENSK